MSEVQENLAAVLRRAAVRLRGAELPGELAERMERLAEQVHQPCVVAVVGRVKVGKSTFVNALLGEDLAKVGTTETTATINYFSHGQPPNPDRPVRCHWRGGKFTDESREFLDSLQGNDIETLRRADGIDHLVYFLSNPYLKQITLVDTPGTGAVVEEHRGRTAEFMQLNGQLRERHDQDTRQLGDTADAVIYLVGPVAKLTDQAFLEEFGRTTGGRSSALNAIGVLSKIELRPEILARRHELSAKIAGQLKESLNTVVPVAAGARRALDSLLEDDAAGLARMVTELRRIPPNRLEMLLDSEEFFQELDFDDCPVGPDERRELLGDMRWGVFTTIARVAADPELGPGEVARRLEEISGFGPLEKILDKHFIERGHILRCYRIVNDAQEVLSEIRYTYLPQRRKEMRQEKDRLDRFLHLIGQAGGDPAARGELEEFVRYHLDVNRREDEVEKLHGDIESELGSLFHQLIEYNEDFETLQMLEDSDHNLSPAELDELRPLLGLYGGEVEKRLPPGSVSAEYVGERQLYWVNRRAEAPYGTFEYAVVDRAYTRYGMILDEILDEQSRR